MPGSLASVSPSVEDIRSRNFSSGSAVTGAARSNKLLGSGLAVTTTGGSSETFVTPGFDFEFGSTGGAFVCANKVPPMQRGASRLITKEREGQRRDGAPAKDHSTRFLKFISLLKTSERDVASKKQ